MKARLLLGIALLAANLCQGKDAATGSATGKTPAAEKSAATANGRVDAELPGVDEILAKYVTAIGGKDAVLKINSRLVKGSFEMPAMGLKGTADIYAKAPDKSLMVMTVPGFGVLQQGYNGTVGWAQDPLQGVRNLEGLELAMLKRTVDFHRDIRLKDAYPKMIVTGKAKVGEADTYMIEATPPEGSPEKLYFDAQTGLLLRSDFDFEGPQGKLTIETYFENYQSADGVKLPRIMRQVNPAFSIVTKIDEVKSNVSIADSKFDKPKPPPTPAQ
ncbi:MAG TPA: hypothetical protein VHH73_07115 [Verrucomicrobiae bacterium]|nr:hypothetical protein [Verrucomicrobiae bacterium]